MQANFPWSLKQQENTHKNSICWVQTSFRMSR